MHVGFTLDAACSVDDLWDVLNRPIGLVRVMGPLMRVNSVSSSTLPARWPDGDTRVRLRLLGLIPMGTQRITVSREDGPGSARTFIDSGGAETGPLALLCDWNHRMSVLPAEHGARLVDRLEFGRGFWAIALWVPVWLTWQMRRRGLRAIMNDLPNSVGESRSE